MVFYAVGQPGFFFDELRLRSFCIEAKVEKKGKNERNEDDAQGDITEEVFFVPVNKYEKNGSYKRNESDKSQYWKIHFLKQ